MLNTEAEQNSKFTIYIYMYNRAQARRQEDIYILKKVLIIRVGSLKYSKTIHWTDLRDE